MRDPGGAKQTMLDSLPLASTPLTWVGTALERHLGELAPLGVAFLLGAGVALLRARLRPGSGRDGLAWVLIVLAPLMCLVVRAIEGDIAKAFGLVGILALVRFRTPMREPADAVFVLVSVAAGVVVAARGDLLMAVVGVLALGVGAWAAHVVLHRAGPDGAQSDVAELRLRCLPSALTPVESSLRAACADLKLMRADLGAGSTPCEVRYAVRLAADASVAALARALAGVEGVLAVSAQRTPEPDASAAP